jgi:DNA-binding NarL/FixJ family response regulator
MTVSVVVADDHPVVRSGLVAILDGHPGLCVVGTAADGEEALLRCAELHPDVVVMDLRMPRLDGIGATRRLTAEQPRVRVLVLTTYDTDADVLRAMEAGATGYLLKDAPIDVLTAAVFAAARGETVLAPPVAARLMRRLGKPPEEPLTPREVDVLKAVARGLTNAGIARELFIGEATVKTHLVRVLNKLGVDDRAHAVIAATERGILP